MFALCVVLLLATDGKWWGDVLIGAYLLEGALLITSVLYMRMQIRLIGGVMHEKLVWIHLINFVVWSAAFVAQNLICIQLEEMSGFRILSEKE